MSAEEENLFTALRAGLADFRAKVEGAPGNKVGALGASTGLVPELARRVLSAVAEALTWLAQALREAVDVLRAADALLALIEVAAAFVSELTASVDFGEVPSALGLDPRPFQAVADAARTVKPTLEFGMGIALLVPSPEDLAGVRRELKLLLGRRADPALKDEGSLGQLLAELASHPP